MVLGTELSHRKTSFAPDVSRNYCHLCSLEQKPTSKRPRPTLRVLVTDMTDTTCTECNATFSRMSSLRRHSEKHKESEQRRFISCHICSRVFLRADRLKRHMNIHTGKDLQYCQHCGRGFRRDYLDTHKTSCRQRLRTSSVLETIKTTEAFPSVDIDPNNFDVGSLGYVSRDRLVRRLQFVHENARRPRDVIGEAECAIRDDNLPGLESLIRSMPEPWSTVTCFQKFYEDEAIKWRRGDSDRDSPLTVAAAAGAMRSLKYLLSPWHTLSKTPHGPILLNCAAQSGQCDVITYLVKGCKANLNIRTYTSKGYDRTTPLATAVVNGNIRTVECLLDLGADLDAQCDSNETPIISVAIKSDHHELARLLIRHGAEGRAGDRCGTTSLHEAAKRGAIAVMHDLIDRGASLDATSKYMYTGTALKWAIDYGQVDAVRLLIQSGASVRHGGDCDDYPARCGYVYPSGPYGKIGSAIFEILHQRPPKR